MYNLRKKLQPFNNLKLIFNNLKKFIKIKE